MHQSLAMTGILLLCIASAAGAETGLVAHYTFDGDSGPMAQDASGRGHDAKIIGGRITEDGHGHCLLLDAEEAYVDAGVSPDFEGLSGGAFELWFKPQEFWGGLVNWSTGGRWQDIRLTLAFNTYSGGSSFLAAVANGRVHESLVLARPQRNVWTHAAVSFRGPQVTVYVDGVPVRSQTVNCVPHRQGLPLWIGKCEGLGRACFRGWIDEVRVYDRPITESEVLAHYKQHAEVMGKDTSHFDAPIVDVLTLPEPGTVMVIAQCALMRPIPDGATLAASLGKDGVPRVEQTVFVDSGGAPISVALDATQLVAGEYQLRAEVRAPGGRTLGRPAAVKVKWPGRAQDFANVRVLNNVVWELLNVEPGAVSGCREFSFTNPKRRWGFVALTAEVGPGGKLQLVRQRAPNDILITIAGETATTAEAMRPMPPGEHCIVLTAEGPCIVKKLVVRSIPESVYADYGCEPHVTEHGPYVGAFLDRYVLPNVNTSIIGGTPGDQPHIQRWLERGGRWLNHCGVPRERAGGEPVGVNVGKGGAGTQPQPLTAEDAAGYIARTAGFSDPRFTGAIADEFGDSEPLCAIYAQAVRNLAADPKYKGKMFYPYANDLYNGPEGIAFTRALVETGSAIAWKRYPKTQADVNSARRVPAARAGGEGLGISEGRTRLARDHRRLLRIFFRPQRVSQHKSQRGLPHISGHAVQPRGQRFGLLGHARFDVLSRQLLRRGVCPVGRRPDAALRHRGSQEPYVRRSPRPATHDQRRFRRRHKRLDDRAG